MEKKDNYIEIEGAKVHNLKNINLKIPREKLVVITGISGSGKSSLINQTLYPILNNYFPIFLTFFIWVS